MSLKGQLDADLKDAMRAGNHTRRDTLRLLLTAIRNAEIPPEAGEPASESAAGPQRLALDDEAVLAVIRKEVKQRRDNIDIYRKAGREELAGKEEAELTVLADYLPQQMSREQIAVVVQAAIERLGASGPGDKGKVMPVVMSELRGKAEGRDINAVVSELLAPG